MSKEIEIPIPKDIFQSFRFAAEFPMNLSDNAVGEMFHALIQDMALFEGKIALLLKFSTSKKNFYNR
jgi:hypothetical protein